MIFENSVLQESEIKLLVKASENVYQNQTTLNGWEVITQNLTDPSYGLSSDFITGNTFR